MMSAAPPPSLREQTRAAVRAQIAEAALDLFAEHGFDEVTVEQIAAAAGISTRSFNRYFPAKEDAILGDTEPWGVLVRDTLENRPVNEPVWESLRHAFSALLAMSDMSGERQKRGMRVLNSAPSLRARNLEKHLGWASTLTPIVARRIGGADADLRAYAVVQCAIACFEAALNAWAIAGETRSPDELLALSFGALSGT